MNYQEVINQARECIGEYCKACNICNGKACKNQIPGPGAKGVGDTAIRNYEKWQEIRVNMDTICANGNVDTSVQLFGQTFRYPFFAGPVGAVNLHYGEKYDDLEYNKILVKSCSENGVAAFTGDGTNPAVMQGAVKAISSADGKGVPTVKPWNMETIHEKIELVRESGCFAIAMDVDAAGLPFLKNMNPPAGSKTVQELAEIVKMAQKPFIVKGIMTVHGALAALESGASGIVVSNHGGRVLDETRATVEVLPEIVEAVNGRMTILIDGGIRTGRDIYKCLALGADGVLIGRPLALASVKGGAKGLEDKVNALKNELSDAMLMTGKHTIKEISKQDIYME